MWARDNSAKQDTLNEIMTLINTYYVDAVNIPPPAQTSIDSILNHLDLDCWYLPSRSLPKQDTHMDYEGIGLNFSLISDTLTVISPILGGPSDDRGITTGDKILNIDGESAIAIKPDEIFQKLRGPKGTKVKITILRCGIKQPLEFEISRGQVPLYSIDISDMLNKQIGYIRINRLSQNTHDEFVDALNKLNEHGMKKLILDLRSNPGGYMEQAFKIADEILPKGKMVLSIKGHSPKFNEQYTSTGNGHYSELPLIVLINAGTAAGSEIIAAAIQDLDRGLVVGEISYGNGIIQREFYLPNQSTLRLTIGRWYSPAGRCINHSHVKQGNENLAFPFDTVGSDQENIQHEIDGHIAKSIFHTQSGRTVSEGCALIPDYLVRQKRSLLIAQLRLKNVFPLYAETYIKKNREVIQQNFGDDLNRFRTNFLLSDEMIADLSHFAAMAGIEGDSIQYQKDKFEIQTHIQRQIAKLVWGYKGWNVVIDAADHQLQKALELFPEAEKLSGLH